MRTNLLKTAFSFVTLSCLLVYCKKSSEMKAETYASEKNWICENGGIYQDGKLSLKSIDGTIKTATLNWSAVHTFKVGETSYVEVPFSFFGGNNNTRLNSMSDNDVSFSFMIRYINGKTEAAIKFTQRNVKLKNAGSEKSGSIDGYSSLEGAQLNMWFRSAEGILMSMRKQAPVSVKTYGTKQVTTYADFGGGCSSFTGSTYEFHCWITGAAYDDVACGWVLVGSQLYLLCSDEGNGSGNGGGNNGGWPPSGGGAPSSPPPNTPCAGDATANPSIAPSSAHNKQGGRFGPTRIDPNTGGPKQHNGLDLSAVPNTAVYSPFNGKVLKSISIYPPTYYKANSFGNFVVVETTMPNGSKFTTLYGHLNSAYVTSGTIIQAGDQIGLSGRTGNAQRVQFPHVHIQIKDENGNFVNPEDKLATKFNTQGNSTGRPCN